MGCSSPDHAWASVYSIHWDCTIECPTCQQVYVVDGADTAMRIVRRADTAAVMARRNAYDAARKQFMASPSVAALKRDFAAHLNGLKSVAAIFKCLEANGLAGYAIGTFRKQWQGAEHWVDQHIGIGNAGRVAGLLGQNTTAFAAQLAQIEALPGCHRSRADRHGQTHADIRVTAAIAMKHDLTRITPTRARCIGVTLHDLADVASRRIGKTPQDSGRRGSERPYLHLPAEVEQLLPRTWLSQVTNRPHPMREGSQWLAKRSGIASGAGD